MRYQIKAKHYTFYYVSSYISLADDKMGVDTKNTLLSVSEYINITYINVWWIFFFFTLKYKLNTLKSDNAYRVLSYIYYIVDIHKINQRFSN